MANYYDISSRTLEITIVSGEDLRLGKRPVKKNAYVTVRSDPEKIRSTATDKHGGSFPKWDQKLVLDLPAHAPGLSVEVRCKTAFGDRLVGAASVPASDFFGGYAPESRVRFLSYRLRNSRGERSGIVNISVTTKGGPAAEKYTCSAEAAAEQATAVGVPVGRNDYFGGVVTGIPVWLSHN